MATMIEMDGDVLIRDAQLAEEWGTTMRTLRKYDHEPDGLPFILIGGKKWRPRKACGLWLARRIVQ